MKQLYLVNFTIRVSNHTAEEDRYDTGQRLVWAASEEQAINLLNAEYTYSDPNGETRAVQDFEIIVPLGSPNET